jgi:hypothetical protein
MSPRLSTSFSRAAATWIDSAAQRGCYPWWPEWVKTLLVGGADTLMQDRSTDSEPFLRWFRGLVGEVGKGTA